jgi:hypothetical protein
MLVGDTQANALLSRVFINQQQPEVAYPTGFVLGDGSSGKHRRLQMAGDRLIVTIETHAATPAGADRIVQRLVTSTGASLMDRGSQLDACDAALAACVNARTASTGECLVCANKHIEDMPECVEGSLVDDFCR